MIRTASNKLNTYVKLLAGNVRMPESAHEKVIFQTMMVFCMVTCMVTFNGFLHYGNTYITNFTDYLWYYPVTFCMAFTVRSLIGNPVTGKIIPHFVLPNFKGVARGAMTSVVNILVMATVMCAFSTLLRGHIADFTWVYFTTLPIIWLAAFCINFFLVGPFVKALFGVLAAKDEERESSGNNAPVAAAE